MACAPLYQLRGRSIDQRQKRNVNGTFQRTDSSVHSARVHREAQTFRGCLRNKAESQYPANVGRIPRAFSYRRGLLSCTPWRRASNNAIHDKPRDKRNLSSSKERSLYLPGPLCLVASPVFLCNRSAGKDDRVSRVLGVRRGQERSNDARCSR